MWANAQRDGRPYNVLFYSVHTRVAVFALYFEQQSSTELIMFCEKYVTTNIHIIILTMSSCSNSGPHTPEVNRAHLSARVLHVCRNCWT